MSAPGRGGRKALGRGLSALIPERRDQPTDRAARNYFLCPIEEIHPAPDQPRQHFSDESIQELADSIREQGLLQPLVVRQADPGYELIAGERRWRAAQRASLRELPVVVKDVSSSEAFEMALVENIQREDLHPLEEAAAYARIQKERGYSTEDLARRVGKDRSTVANAMRLLALTRPVQEMIAAGELSAGHGRALLGLTDPQAQLVLARRARDARLSVRAVERLVRQLRAERNLTPSKNPKETSTSVRRLNDDLSRKLGTRVRVRQKGKGGRIEIHYHSLDELDRLLELLR